MNNKNIIGIFVYVVTMTVVAILPSLCVHSFFYALECSQNDSCSSSITLVENILLILGIFVTPILYFLLPIIATILAIKNHWSTYLDKFLNSFIVPTILFFLAIVVTLIYNHLAYFTGQGSVYLLYIYYAIVPPYCLIYFVILINNICRRCPNQCKKISKFINKFRGIHIE